MNKGLPKPTKEIKYYDWEWEIMKPEDPTYRSTEDAEIMEYKEIDLNDSENRVL